MPTIRSLTRQTSSWNPARQFRQETHYVDVSAVSRDRLQIGEVEPIAAATAPSRARKIIETDDTIIATIRPGLKRVAKIPAALHGELASTAFCVLRPNTALIDPDYLFFVIGSDEFIASVAAHETGASYPAVRDQDVLDREIELPSLSTQRRIACALKAVRSSLLLQFDLLESTERLKAQAMSELFVRGVRGEAQEETAIGFHPANWHMHTLGELGRIGNGTTPNRQNSTYWTGGEIPWITSGRMYDRRISTSEIHVTEVALKDCSLPRLSPGAVLIAIVGQGKTLGHCAILEVPATVSRHVGFIQPKHDLVRSDYLVGYLEFRYEHLRQLAAGNGSTRAALTCAILRNVRVPLPDLDEQAEIANVLEAINRKIELHRQKRTVLEALFKALLHKLMTGEIDVNELDLSALGVEAEEVA